VKNYFTIKGEKRGTQINTNIMKLSILTSPGVTTLLIPFVLDLIKNNFFYMVA